MLVLEKKELFEGHNLTAGDIVNFIAKHGIPHTAPVVIQRIEDKYFEGIDISGLSSAKGILPPGSKSTPWRPYLKMQNGLPTQYIPAFSCVYYKDDEDILFIDIHY